MMGTIVFFFVVCCSCAEWGPHDDECGSRKLYETLIHFLLCIDRNAKKGQKCGTVSGTNVEMKREKLKSTCDGYKRIHGHGHTVIGNTMKPNTQQQKTVKKLLFPFNEEKEKNGRTYE